MDFIALLSFHYGDNNVVYIILSSNSFIIMKEMNKMYFDVSGFVTNEEIPVSTNRNNKIQMSFGRIYKDKRQEKESRKTYL